MIRKVGAFMMKNLQRMMGIPTCQEIEEFSYLYMEDRLDPDTKARFEKHLEGCSSCKRFIETYGQVAEPDKFLKEVPLDSELEDRITEFLRQELQKTKGQPPEN